MGESCRLFDDLEAKEMAVLLRNPSKLVELYFEDDSGEDFVPYSYQDRIIQTLLLKKPRYNAILGCRRAGKSEAIAIGAILLAMFRSGETIRIVAPTKKKTRIIMNYILDHLSDHGDVLNSLDDISRSKDDLKNQLSKKRITWKTGSEISILTANISGDGRSVVGQGASTLIVDESELIPSSIVRSNILTMLGDDEDHVAMLISNAVDYGFIYENKDRDKWLLRRIDWREAVDEGRLSRGFVEDRREEMTNDEFMIWYEARYPEKMEDNLFSQEWVLQALNESFDLPGDEDGSVCGRVFGLDVARGGSDKTVLTDVVSIEAEDRDSLFVLRDVWSWDDSDKESTARNVSGKLVGGVPVFLDAIGVGGPVGDQLRELGFDVRDVKVSESPRNDPEERFRNKKAEGYWKLREVLEEGRIDLLEDKSLQDELMDLKYDLDSRGRIVIEDPAESPDIVDSLMLAIYGVGGDARRRVASSSPGASPRSGKSYESGRVARSNS